MNEPGPPPIPDRDKAPYLMLSKRVIGIAAGFAGRTGVERTGRYEAKKNDLAAIVKLAEPVFETA